MDSHPSFRSRTVDAGTEDLPMFAAVDDNLERDTERLTTLAGELALKAGRYGVTVSDLRVTAVNRGILTGQESSERMKRLDLGKVMANAGLFGTGQYRRSDVERAHRNLNQVYVVREFAERTA